MILLPARARAGGECAGDESYGLGSSPRNLFLACSRLPLKATHARLSRVDLGADPLVFIAAWYRSSNAYHSGREQADSPPSDAGKQIRRLL